MFNKRNLFINNNKPKFDGNCIIKCYEEYDRYGEGSGTITLSSGRLVNWSANTNSDFIVESTVEELNGTIKFTIDKSNYSFSTLFISKNNSNFFTSEWDEREGKFSIKISGITKTDSLVFSVMLSSSI